jgi:hypothetical protein
VVPVVQITFGFDGAKLESLESRRNCAPSRAAADRRPITIGFL